MNDSAESGAPSGIPAAVVAAACIGSLAILSAIVAYYRMFSGFAGWDDEGTLLMTVKQYLAGARLYERIFTGYGPVYYYFNALTHAGGAAVAHNAVRIASVAVWLGCSSTCAAIVWRLTRSLPVAFLAYAAVFRSLGFFRNEPGHPQELCVMLLVALAGIGIFADNRRAAPTIHFITGCIAAALLLIKVNIGIFAIVAVSLAVIIASQPSTLLRIAKYSAIAAALFLPFVLMRVHLDDPREVAYCAVVTASVAALAIEAVRQSQLAIPPSRAAWPALSGFLLAVLLLFLPLLIQGISPRSILFALVLQHVSVNVSQRAWFNPVELSPYWILWAVLAAMAAALRWRFLPAAKLLLGSATLLISLFAPAALLGFTTPVCWLLIFPAVSPSPQFYGRLLLTFTTVLQTLYAYPIAGSQAGFIRILPITVGAILLGDGLAWLHIAQSPAVRRVLSSRAVAILVLAGVPAILAVQAVAARREYLALVPLQLPGAERVHVEPYEARSYGWLTRQVKLHCETFVGYPGLPSLYLWSGVSMAGPVDRYPGPLNFDDWMFAMTPAQQEVIVADFSQHPNACVVYNPSGVKSWNKADSDLSGLPLVRYIQSNFKTVGGIEGFQLMIRNDRKPFDLSGE